MSKKREIAAALLGIVVALILWLALLNRETLLGTQAAYQPLRVFRTAWKNIQKYGITGNFLGNIIAFMPFGFLLPAVTGKEKWYLAIPAGLGFAVKQTASCYSIDLPGAL